MLLICILFILPVNGQEKYDLVIVGGNPGGVSPQPLQQRD